MRCPTEHTVTKYDTHTYYFVRYDMHSVKSVICIPKAVFSESFIKYYGSITVLKK